MHPDGIDVDRRQPGRRLDPELDAGGRRPRPMGRGDVLEQDRRVRRLAVEWQRAGLGEAQGSEIVDEPLQHPRLLEDRADVGRVGRVDPVEQGLEVALDHRERGSELVGDVGEEAAARRILRLEPCGHRVEGPAQASHLASALVIGDPNGVVGSLDPPGGIDELRERSPDAARDADADDQRDDPDDEHDEPGGPRQVRERPLCRCRSQQPRQQPQDEHADRDDQRRHERDEAPEAAAHATAVP